MSGKRFVDPLLRKALGRALERARVAAGISQSQVAAALRCSQARVSRKEAGYEPVTVHDLFAFAEAYGMRASVLLEQAVRLHEGYCVLDELKARDEREVQA